MEGETFNEEEGALAEGEGREAELEEESKSRGGWEEVDWVIGGRRGIDGRGVLGWRGARKQLNCGARQEGTWKSVQMFNKSDVE